jgi:hypothetical protein
MRSKQQVFAVIRIDEFHEATTPIEHKVTVKEVVGTQELAEREVERLMRLNADKGCRYFWQATRFADVGGPAS